MSLRDTLAIWHPGQGRDPTDQGGPLKLGLFGDDHLGWQLSSAAESIVVFDGIMPDWWRGPTIDTDFERVSIDIWYSGDSAADGAVVWTAAFMDMSEGNQDIDLDGTPSPTTVTHTQTGAQGVINKATIQIDADATSMNSLGRGDEFLLEIERDGAAGGDDQSSASWLFCVHVYEDRT